MSKRVKSDPGYPNCVPRDAPEQFASRFEKGWRIGRLAAEAYPELTIGTKPPGSGGVSSASGS